MSYFYKSEQHGKVSLNLCFSSYKKSLEFGCLIFGFQISASILMHLLDQTAILQQKLQIGSPYFFYSELQQLFFRKGQFRLQ